jgi:hypothetical protein
MSLPKLNPVEPPWYGPVCPVVGEGWHREVSPYPDQPVFRPLAREFRFLERAEGVKGPKRLRSLAACRLIRS